MITVLIAYRHVSVHRALRALLEDAGDIEIVGMTPDGREAVEQAALYSPDVVVMDVSMPFMDSIEATRQIRTNFPQTRVLMLASMFSNASDIKSCIQAGALGCVLKDAGGNELVTAIRTVSRNEWFFSKGTAKIAQIDGGVSSPVASD